MTAPRMLAAGIALLAALTVAGCGGDDGGDGGKGAGKASTPSPSAAAVKLATYKGAGFTVGYPAEWGKVSGHTVVPKAAFEVGVKSRDGRSMEASFDVLVNEDLPFPLARISSDFVAFSRPAKNFRLIGRTKVELDGAEGWEVRKSYRSPEGKELKQYDLFTKTPQGKVIDVRIIMLPKLYDSNQAMLDSVRSSFRFAP
ncbi:hypothetical protein [Actinomadura sp. B10D3]|uniref:hypothetical protein n=1 Tax=Actinomadura sp. B10D3 TaxID=3153557 RepID=UPI00325D0D63